jgi:hypothetical protein
MAVITQIKAGTRAKISLVLAKVNGVPAIGVFVSHLYKNSTDIDDALDALNDQDVVFRVDGKIIASTPSAWTKSKGGALFMSVPISNNAVKSLNTGRVLSLNTNVSNAVRNYDASLDFSLSELNRLLPAVLRGTSKNPCESGKMWAPRT